MKEVLHIITGLNIGGSELVLNRLISAHLSYCSYSNVVVSLTTVGAVGEILRKKGVLVYCLDITSFLDVPRAFCELKSLIEDRNPEIVQTWMYHSDLLGGLAARMAGVTNIIWGVRSTDLNSSGTGSTYFVRKICALLSSFIPKFIVCAAEASREAHIAAGYAPSRMVVIPNGFQMDQLVARPDLRAELRSQCGFNQDTTVIGMLGRFHEDKDQGNFVCACGLLAKRYPDLRFLMVGRGLVENNAQLMQMINATGYHDRFVLLGERLDVPVCLSAMDIFCSSSRTEGFPNAVGEAMAMGLPCVVTDVGDTAILVGEIGVVVPKEDSNALAVGLGKLVSMPVPMRLQMGEALKTRIELQFSIKIVRQQFDALYSKMLMEGTK